MGNSINTVLLSNSERVERNKLPTILKSLMEKHGEDATDDQIDLENEIQSHINGTIEELD